jgi:hypothetical protein
MKECGAGPIITQSIPKHLRGFWLILGSHEII